ncbi:hypothetical protein IAQ61_007684, partial [Plenodomus lingam]
PRRIVLRWITPPRTTFATRDRSSTNLYSYISDHLRTPKWTTKVFTMPSATTVSFVLLLILAISIEWLRPTIMTETTGKPWADSPCALITTPQYATKKDDIFTLGATHMAHIHNAILRGYNSIYLQAPHVQEADNSAFVGYALTWYRFVKSHHDDEEAELFPKVEEVLGSKDIWQETYQEHESFLGGLVEFENYLSNLETPHAFDGNHLINIMKSFQDPFCHHFQHEITTIASFGDLPSAPAPNSPEAAQAAAVFKAWGKKTVTKAGTYDVVPFFLMNLDADYEGGLWANWPPMPAPVRWGLVNVAGAVHWGWWKFASCDGLGRRRELFAIPSDGST